MKFVGQSQGVKAINIKLIFKISIRKGNTNLRVRKRCWKTKFSTPPLSAGITNIISLDFSKKKENSTKSYKSPKFKKIYECK